MLEKEQGENDSGKRNRKNDDDSQAGWWVIVIAGLVLLGVIALVGFTLIEHKDRVTFLTVNALSALIAEAVAMQVYIYRKQWKAMQKQSKSMDQSVVYGLRAYVGVHSIDFDSDTDRIVLQIENIGKVPAENIDVFVEIEVKIPAEFVPPVPLIERVLGATIPVTNVPQKMTFGIRHKFGAKTKLFPGNLKIKIRIPLEPWFAPDHIALIKSGDARLVARGNINFMDGFNKDKNSAFAFRYRLSEKCWFPHPLLSLDDLRKKQIEEIPYYEDEDEKEAAPN